MDPKEAKKNVLKNNLFRDQLKAAIKDVLLEKNLQQNELCVIYGKATNKESKPYDTGHMNKMVNVWGGYEQRAADLYEFICELP